jgi:hypothetical protein
MRVGEKLFNLLLKELRLRKDIKGPERKRRFAVVQRVVNQLLQAEILLGGG